MIRLSKHGDVEIVCIDVKGVVYLRKVFVENVTFHDKLILAYS